MPTITITQLLAGVPALPPHPKAIMRAEGGDEFTYPYAPRGTSLGGYANPRDQLTRPGRKPLVQRNGAGLLTLSHTITLARPDHQDTVEDYIAKLAGIAASDQRVTLLNLSPQEQGPWYLTGVSVAGEQRQHGTNHITRATVTLDYLEAPPIAAGPVAGGPSGASATAGSKVPKTYTLRKGDTLRSVAHDVYGDVKAWRLIAAVNNIKGPTILQVGRVLKLPPARPSYDGLTGSFII